ncbi:hypothetical protein [Streptomyces sp. enrichment culture]|uniref:hypothetical protein n=1 Tax=Streptomyces sp. enrichment culture TaxID=1795815 RepID=UPI003F55455C
MPRGRHRHSPPLHRLLPPSAIAGVSLVCALGPWVFTQPAALRLLAAVAAATATAGAVVMRRWDAQAGKRVADLTRARASDEWRYEERTAELESDLEESRELRVKLEQRLRAKRAELAGLRNEHAALLRRYAAAEADRASVLEDRRVLEIEAAVPARALPAGASDAAGTEGAEHTGTADAGAAAETVPGPRTGDDASGTDASGTEEAAATRAFSPEGSQLFLRAGAALARFERSAGTVGTDTGASTEPSAESSTEPSSEADTRADADGDTSGDADEQQPGGAQAGPVGAGAEDAADDDVTAQQPGGTYADDGTGRAPTAAEGAPGRPAPGGVTPHTPRTPRTGLKGNGFRKRGGSPRDDGPDGAARRPGEAREDDAEGKTVAAAEHDRATAAPAGPTGPAASPAPAGSPSARQPSGHFTVPTAVAVVPPTVPVRRPVTGDGFDFFGTKKGAEEAALEEVQNEDLADVVGPEALALHKAEAEAGFKAAGDEARAVGQVIDLTEHDETEHIDVEGLRSAVS